MASTPGYTNYSFDQVTCLFGPIVMDGFEEDGGISVEPVRDYFEEYQSADGKVVRVVNSGNMTRVTIRLNQASSTNTQLSAYVEADKASHGALGPQPFFLNDKNGLSLMKGGQAWIKGPPKNVTFNRTVSGREWVIIVARMDRVDGGN